MTDQLPLKYRPSTFDDVIGQDAAIVSIEKLIQRRKKQVFLLCGPSGTGKTTIARIAAKLAGCSSADIIEVDAATYTGVDEMRRIKETMRYVPLGKSAARAIIVDEAHMLSKSSWNSLLKDIEEPPPFAYWFFCTTEPGKVPETIKSRCAPYTLKSVSEEDLTELCLDICKMEHIKLREDIVALIVTEALGSPRQMLVNLELCRDAKDKRSAAELLESAHASEPVLELCRFIAKGKGSWSRAMSLVEKLDGENPESVRIVLCMYVSKALRGSTTDKAACFYLQILEHFSTSYNPSEGMAPLLVSIGRVLYGQAQ